MKTLVCILLMLTVTKYGVADELVTDELCVKNIVGMKSFIEKNKSFLIEIKYSREDFVNKLSRINQSLKNTLNYMIKCTALHHVQSTRAAFETPYFPVMVSLNKVYSRLHHIERNPDSVKQLIGKLYQEELEKLESALNKGTKNSSNNSLKSGAPLRGAP